MFLCPGHCQKFGQEGEHTYLQACLEFFKNIFMDGHRITTCRFNNTGFNGINIQYVLFFSKLFKFTFFKKIRRKGTDDILLPPPYISGSGVSRAAVSKSASTVLDKTKSKGCVSKCKGFLTTAVL